MCDLIQLLERCQHDTQELLGDGAAGRLAYWQNYRNDRERLIKFIQDWIHGDSWRNGAKLDNQGKLSLARKVVQCGGQMFEARDLERAQATLNMAMWDAT